MKRYYDIVDEEMKYMPGYDDNSPLTATEKLMAEGLKKKPLTAAELGQPDPNNKTIQQLKALRDFGQNPLIKRQTTPAISTQLDLFNNLPIQHKPKIKKTNFGNVKIIPEKQTYPFDTVKGIDHVTKTFREESPDKLSPKEEANLNILNKEMKLGVLKDELGGVKKYDQYDKTTYPSDPEQRRRLKNINEIEKDLGYKSPEINVPYKKDLRTPNQKKADAWKARQGGTAKRSNSWDDLKSGKITNIVKDKSPSNWDLIKQTSKSPTEIAEIRRTVNDHVKSMGTTKFLSPDEYKYLDKPKQPAPSSVSQDTEDAYLNSQITDQEQPQQTPDIDVREKIKEMADARLAAEQKDWDYRYGKGGIPGLKRPE